MPRTKAAFVPCIGAAAADKTLAFCAVFSAQTVCMCLGGAAIDRARFRAVSIAEPSGVDLVWAALHRAHLLCAVFAAHAVCLYLGGTAIDRARLLVVCRTEPLRFDFVRAAPHRAHLRGKAKKRLDVREW